MAGALAGRLARAELGRGDVNARLRPPLLKLCALCESGADRAGALWKGGLRRRKWQKDPRDTALE